MIIQRVRVHETMATAGEWPFTVPAVAALVGEGLTLDRPVTFLVGENGSGKSTVVEAIAEAYGIDVRGGDGARKYASELEKSALGEVIALERGEGGLRMVSRRAKGYFLRAETALDVFERAKRGPAFLQASHGESFLAAFASFNDRGVYILDEPEAALSFTACLSLIDTIQTLAADGSQVICATHSPILTTLPGADIVEFGEHGFRRTGWADLEVVQHWRRFLDAPERYLRHLGV